MMSKEWVAPNPIPRDAIPEIKPGRGRNRKIADWLNQRGIMTFEGRKWTDENVRKAIIQLEIDR